MQIQNRMDLSTAYCVHSPNYKPVAELHDIYARCHENAITVVWACDECSHVHRSTYRSSEGAFVAETRRLVLRCVSPGCGGKFRPENGHDEYYKTTSEITPCPKNAYHKALEEKRVRLETSGACKVKQAKQASFHAYT